MGSTRIRLPMSAPFSERVGECSHPQQYVAMAGGLSNLSVWQQSSAPGGLLALAQGMGPLGQVGQVRR